MVELKEGDFVSVEFDIYANGNLVQTTNEKKGKEANLKVEKYAPETIILGKAFVLKALDEDIIKNKGKDNSLELETEKAYGRRDKKNIKIFKKSVFDEKKLRAVPGMTYDFNGMYGTVKSVVGGRVTVDFNNPLAGRAIKLDYTNVKKIDDITQKINVILESILRIPKGMYEISAKDKQVNLKVPEQLLVMKEHLLKSFDELINDFKNYKVSVEKFEIKKK